MKGMKDAAGNPFTDIRVFRGKLMDELALGRECLPIGKPCEGWNWKTGCPGHQEAEADVTK